MLSRINFVCMPHKNNSLFIQNGWNYKPNPNSFPNYLSMPSLPSLGGLSLFIFLQWLLYSNIVTSNKYVHFHHRFCIAHILFNFGSLWFACCHCHIRPTVHFSLFHNFFARSLWRYLQFNFHLWPLQALSIQWETIWGTKAEGWPPCPNGGIRLEKS